MNKMLAELSQKYTLDEDYPPPLTSITSADTLTDSLLVF